MHPKKWFSFLSQHVKPRRLRPQNRRVLAFELLEDRCVPAITISGLDTALGQVTFTGDGASDVLVLSVNPLTGNLEHNLADGVNIESPDDLDPNPGSIQTMTVGVGTAR